MPARFFTLFAASFCLAALSIHANAQTPAIPSSAVSSDSIDREAAYQKALPEYHYDAAKPLDVKYGSSKTFTGYRQTHISYLNDKGERVPGLLFTPSAASAANPVPCLILLHGLEGSKEEMMPFAQAAATWGYASLAIDEWGQGERGSKVASIHSSGALLEGLSAGVRQTAIDVRQAVDILQTRKDINPQRIGLAGISLGAIISVVAAGVEPRIKAVVLISGGGNWAAILKPLAESGHSLNGQKVQSAAGLDWSFVNAILAPTDPVTFAAHIAPRPVLMECGCRDDVIVPAAAQALYVAAQKGKGARVRIDWHDTGHIPPLPLILLVIHQWLRKNL